ncbi:radical SAM protein [Acinetobacter calcoaceticus]|uniref:radical SAM protein n=1 Tax=Acinetobacter calcoaceticus TaxID=471 RepID=UPI002854C7D6|nr:radical SAM protein [Acinetobacter calcoaceticus]MDR6798326.1 uncharacterized protein [Acinetobacter calcoaceticus]
MKPIVIELLDIDGSKKNLIYDVQRNLLLWESDNSEVSLSRVGRKYKIPDEPWEHYTQKKISPILPGLKKGPFRLVKIQLGLSCNFKCDYCAQSPKENSLEVRRGANREERENFVNNLLNYLQVDEHVIFELWGGEPFLYWETFKEISESLLISFPFCKVRTTTNGSLINQEIFDWILRNERVEIILSHDGPGTHRDQDVLDNHYIRKLYTELFKFNRHLKFNCVLTIDNLSVEEIRKYIADKLNTSCEYILLLTEGLAMPIKQAVSLPSLLDLTGLYREMIDGNSLFIFGNELQDFFDIISQRKPNVCVEQKCGLDREDVIVVNVKTQDIVTCQNTLPEGRHKLGNLKEIESVQLNTAYHWRSRPNCENCPVLNFCRGCCLYLEGESFNRACLSQFYYRLPFFSAALYWITGLTPIKMKSFMGEIDLSEMTLS